MGLGGGIEINFKALGAIAISLALAYLFASVKTPKLPPALWFSTLTFFKKHPKNTKAKWSRWPKYLEIAALGLFLAAFLDIRVFVSRPHQPQEIPPGVTSEGIGIYLILDQSGSMLEPASSSFSSTRKQNKLQVLKALTHDFIHGNSKQNLEGRPNDLIGLVAFARVPHVLVPLTLDHASLVDALEKMDAVQDKTHDGTAIGYAIYKTANMMAATRHYAEEALNSNIRAYDIKSSVMIMITDGVQEIHPEDRENPVRSIDIPEAASYSKDQKIRLYIINIEPQIAAEKFAPFRNQMQKAAESTGGKFFMVSATDTLSSIYREIDRLEKSRLPIEWQLDQTSSRDSLPHLFQRIPLYPFFVGLGLFCLLLAVLLKTTWMRQWP